MKNVLTTKQLILCMLFTAIPFFAHANGGSVPGGGKGCRAAFMRSAFVMSQWLEKHGSKLKPQISADDFLMKVNPDQIVEVGTKVDLRDRKGPVTAYFDGVNINIRCDRLAEESPENIQRLIAHEVFRKMGVETDKYEVSRQIWPEPTTEEQKAIQKALKSTIYDVRTELEGNGESATRAKAISACERKLETLSTNQLSTIIRISLKSKYLFTEEAGDNKCSDRGRSHNDVYQSEYLDVPVQYQSCEATCSSITLKSGIVKSNCIAIPKATVNATPVRVKIDEERVYKYDDCRG